MTTKTKTYDFKEGELTTLVSARIRLTEEERQQLKLAYYKQKNSEQPSTAPAIGGAKIGVVHAIQQSDIDQKLGMSHIVVTDLLNSRDSIALPLMLKLQSVLGLSIVDKKRVVDACANYWDYMEYKNDNT